MKRILLVSPLPPYIGGVSVSVQRLYEHLRNEGYEVDTFNTQLIDRRYNFKSLKFLRYLTLPLSLMLQKRYDVIHFHVSHIIPKLYVSMWRTLFSRKTRFIITIHGQITNLFKSRLGYQALKGFDRIICVKKGDRRNMPEKLRSRTVEIPAFIPPLIVKESIADIPTGLQKFLERKTFKMLLNGFVILNQKYYDLYGFKDAISLLSQLKGKGREADLILIVLGEANRKEVVEYLQNLKDYVKSSGIEENVCWIEGVTMELWPLLKKVNVLLRPTKSDGDALSVRESLFLKIPVIASDAVPRPSGAVIYSLKSPDDLYQKTINLMEHYDNFVGCMGSHNLNFAYKIIEQYESN